jgi:hypothetical protein
MKVVILAMFTLVAVIAASFLFAAIGRLSRWNRTYDRLAKRYSGKPGRGRLVYGTGISKPSLSFEYGRTLVGIRNRKSYRFSSGRQKEISMIWPNRKLRLEVSTSPAKSRGWGPGASKPIDILDPQFQFYVSGSDPESVERLLTPGVQWQIEQLRRHMDNNEVHVSLGRGSLLVSKPGYIKDYVALEDFLRFSLELFDQLMLVDAEGIEFVNADQASVVDDVKCPICSERITQNLVVCARCKTPHCQDCWQYNGQCATFACSETRCLHMDNVS